MKRNTGIFLKIRILANYVGDQSFNMMMNVMMNTQSCYQPVNNYQLGTVAQTGLGMF